MRSFRKDVVTVADYTGRDVPNPGVQPQSIAVNELARYVRVTATKLAPRAKDYIFALAELAVVEAGDKPAVDAKRTLPQVTSLDSIEAAPRWQRANLVDGYYPGEGVADAEQLAKLTKRRAEITVELATPEERAESQGSFARRRRRKRSKRRYRSSSVATWERCISAAGPRSPAPVPKGEAAGHLRAGSRSVSQPGGKEVEAGVVSLCAAFPHGSRFPQARQKENASPPARWITDDKNPLTHRMYGRVWQHHFGRGIVDTPNDFGRNGPSQRIRNFSIGWPVEFRDGGKYIERQSLKSLH